MSIFTEAKDKSKKVDEGVKDDGWSRFGVYLEGHGDLVSRLITPISHIISQNIPIINLLAKSP